jgi:hypothetical protein
MMQESHAREREREKVCVCVRARVRVHARCPDKSGVRWCLGTVILCRKCLVEESNLMFHNCKFKIWCYCLSFWILLHGILFFCVHMS